MLQIDAPLSKISSYTSDCERKLSSSRHASPSRLRHYAC